MTAPQPTITPSIQSLDELDQADFFDGSPVAMFVIGADHVVTHFNQACAKTLGLAADQVIRTKGLGRFFYGHDRPVMADLIVDGAMKEIIDDFYQNTCRSSLLIPDAYEAESFFPLLGAAARWLFFTAAPLRNARGEVIGAIKTLQDITERKLAEAALMTAQLEIEQVVEQRTAQLAEINKVLQEDIRRRELAERELLDRNAQLHSLNAQLSSAHEHLAQSEKLASIGQLVACVAHEINKPIGYIFSNFSTLEKYLGDLFDMLEAYEKAESSCGDALTRVAPETLRTGIELDFLKDDIPTLMRESREGIVRVRKIVQDLKDFLRVDNHPDWQIRQPQRGH